MSRVVERFFLGLLAGIVFASVASVVAPALQLLVAPLACPAGTQSAHVVAVPHVEEPATTVRSFPLVCVTGEEAALAAEWRTLPLLLALGTAGAVLLMVLLAVAGRLRGVAGGSPPAGVGASPARDGPPPIANQAPAFVRLIWLVFATSLAIPAWAMGWAWLALDMPYRSFGCEARSGGRATCYEGEPVFRLLFVLFAALAAGFLVAYALSARNTWRRSRCVARLWRTGKPATASIVEATPTSTRLNHRRIYRFTYAFEPEEGTPAVQFTEKGFASPASVAGANVPILYDPQQPNDAVVLTRPVGAPESEHSPIFR